MQARTKQPTARTNITNLSLIPSDLPMFFGCLFFETFRAQKRGFYDDESVLSMLALHEIAPSVSPLDVLRKGEEMEACWIAFCVTIAISTTKSGTVSSSSFRRGRRSILRRESVVHCRNMLMKTTVSFLVSL